MTRCGVANEKDGALSLSISATTGAGCQVRGRALDPAKAEESANSAKALGVTRPRAARARLGARGARRARARRRAAGARRARWSRGWAWT